MASFIQAITTYGPKAIVGPTAGIDEVAVWLARSSGLNPHAVRMTLGEMSDAIQFFAGMGRPVHLPGIGRFRVSVGRDGERRLNLMPERSLVATVNGRGAFRGEIANGERIGWTDEQYKELWDAEHPADPLELPARRSARAETGGDGGRGEVGAGEIDSVGTGSAGIGGVGAGSAGYRSAGNGSVVGVRGANGAGRKGNGNGGRAGR